MNEGLSKEIAFKINPVKCPHCNKPITHLIYNLDVTYSGIAQIDWSDESLKKTSTSSYEGQYSFYCPECFKEITKFYHRAKKFLLGEKI